MRKCTSEVHYLDFQVCERSPLEKCKNKQIVFVLIFFFIHFTFWWLKYIYMFMCFRVCVCIYMQVFVCVFYDAFINGELACSNIYTFLCGFCQFLWMITHQGRVAWRIVSLCQSKCLNIYLHTYHHLPEFCCHTGINYKTKQVVFRTIIPSNSVLSSAWCRTYMLELSDGSIPDTIR